MPSSALYSLSASDGQRQKPQHRSNSDRQGTGRLHVGHCPANTDSSLTLLAKNNVTSKPYWPELSWPAHRGVAGVRVLFGEATHPGKTHPSVDSRVTAA